MRNSRITNLLVATTIVVSASVLTPAVAGAQDDKGTRTEMGGFESTPGVKPGFSLRYIPEAQTTGRMPGNVDKLVSGFTEDSAPRHSSSPTMGRAVLYSLLVPGLGDWYAGRNHRAKRFFLAEAAIWTSYILFRVQSHGREESYKNLAVEFAGVERSDHSDDFYATIGDHDSSAEYEVEFKKDHRIDLWPDVGYDAMDRYYLENRISDFEEWDWVSWERRVDFHELRTASRSASRRAMYVLALAATNRVVAAIFAYQAVKSNRSDGDVRTGHYRLDFSSPPWGARGDYPAAISLVRSF